MKLGKFNLPSEDEPISADDFHKLKNWARNYIDVIRFVAYVKQNPKSKGIYAPSAFSMRTGKYYAPHSEELYKLTIKELEELESYLSHIYNLKVLQSTVNKPIELVPEPVDKVRKT